MLCQISKDLLIQQNDCYTNYHIVTLTIPKRGMCWFNTSYKVLINKPFVGLTNPFLQCMNKTDIEKLSKSELIKMLLKQKKSKKVRNHEDLLNNDPFKDEVSQPVPLPITLLQKPTRHIPLRDPKTGRFIKIHPGRPKPPKPYQG